MPVSWLGRAAPEIKSWADPAIFWGWGCSGFGWVAALPKPKPEQPQPLSPEAVHVSRSKTPVSRYGTRNTPVVVAPLSAPETLFATLTVSRPLALIGALVAQICYAGRAPESAFRVPGLPLVVLAPDTPPGISLATGQRGPFASFVGYRPHPPRLGGNSQEKLRRAGGLPSPPFARAAQVAHPPACAVARSPLLVSVATRLNGATRCYACSAPSPARWLALLPCRPPRAAKPSGRLVAAIAAFCVLSAPLGAPSGRFLSPSAGDCAPAPPSSGALAPAVVWPCSRRGAALVASSLQASTPSPRRAVPLRFGVPLKPAIRRCTVITLRRLRFRPRRV